MTGEGKIRDLVLEAIANDYEDFGQILKDVSRWAAAKCLSPTSAEIAADLIALIHDGLAKAYILHARRENFAEEVPEAEWRSALSGGHELDAPYYYYVTKRGKTVASTLPKGETDV
jgi:hypothetical protein